MPKLARKKTDLECRRLGKPGFHPVGGVAGLMLQISKTGTKSWVLRIMVAGKRRHIGLGPYSAICLSEARTRAQAMRDKVESGIDPVQERREAKARLRGDLAKIRTFKDLAYQHIQKQAPQFKAQSRQAKVKRLYSLIDKYCDSIVDLPVRDVSLAHVVDILQPIWLEKNPTASLLRQTIEKVVDLATVLEIYDRPNPARWRGNLDAIFPMPGKISKTTHHKALPIDEVPKLIAQLKKDDSILSKSLQFLILAAGRRDEIRLSVWKEICWKDKTWTLPPERMKAGRQHVVPLSKQAAELLKSLPNDSDYIFPGRDKNTPFGVNASRRLLARLGFEGTLHGFRSTFKDWCRLHTKFEDEVSEIALAHVSNDATRAAYARDELIDKRRLLMQDWADFVYTGRLPETVVPLKRAQ